jgi:hypothetical protein
MASAATSIKPSTFVRRLRDVFTELIAASQFLECADIT